MIRALLAPLAALALTSCFLQPGAFDSAMTLNRDGTFAFAYEGQFVTPDPTLIQEFDPAEAAAPDFPLSRAYCYGEPDDGTVFVLRPQDTAATFAESGRRPCTDRELAAERAELREKMDERDQELREMRSVVRLLGGLGDGTEASNVAVAARLNTLPGWTGVTYQGGGVFAGRYHVTGEVGTGFLFPLTPEVANVTPFVRIVPLADGRVQVDAPLLSLAEQRRGFAVLSKLMGLGGPDKVRGFPRASGTFRLLTDGKVERHNATDERADGARRRLSWTVGGPADEGAPTAVVRL